MYMCENINFVWLFVQVSSIQSFQKQKITKNTSFSNEDFPSGLVVKNLLANAGDRDPWSGKISHAVEQLSPCATTTELTL